MRFPLAVAIFVCVLCGCQVAPKVASYPDEVRDDVNEEMRREVGERFEEVLATCEKMSEFLQGKTDKSRRTVLIIATVGIIAGSIIVPALAAKASASKSAIAAWGGVAGAANAGQSLLTKTGISHVSMSDNYRAFSEQVNADVDDFLKANNPSEAMKALYAMESL